jgi:hypothetical protein
VDDHDGKFIETETIIDRYQLRPLIIALMCLIQFAMLYTLLGPKASKKFKEKYKLDKDYLFLPDKKDKKRQILAVCNYNQNNPPKENMTLLPDFVILKNKKVMRLRSYEAVIRRYKFRRENNPHE